MESFAVHTLIHCRDAYCEATGASAATVAQKAGGDWRLFDKLEGRDGAEPTTTTLRKYDAVMAWFDANWPEPPRGVEGRSPDGDAKYDRPVHLADWRALKDFEERGDWDCDPADWPRILVSRQVDAFASPPATERAARAAGSSPADKTNTGFGKSAAEHALAARRGLGVPADD